MHSARTGVVARTWSDDCLAQRWSGENIVNRRIFTRWDGFMEFLSVGEAFLLYSGTP